MHLKLRCLHDGDIYPIVQEMAKATNSLHVGKHAEETSRMLGKDIATDKPLLKDGKD